MKTSRRTFIASSLAIPAAAKASAKAESVKPEAFPATARSQRKAVAFKTEDDYFAGNVTADERKRFERLIMSLVLTIKSGYDAGSFGNGSNVLVVETESDQWGMRCDKEGWLSTFPGQAVLASRNAMLHGNSTW